MFVTFPHKLTQAGPVLVRCRGRIVRASREVSEEMEVVATIERFEFMRESGLAEGAITVKPPVF